MKRQWWEISAGPEPHLACQQLNHVLAPPSFALTCGLPYPETQGFRSPVRHTEATDTKPASRNNSRSPSTPLDSPQPSPTVEPTNQTEDEECLDLATRMCVSRALKVEPKYVCCEAFAYSVLCKQSRGVMILPSHIVELWDILPNSFKYSDGEGKYTVLGANPRKHDAVTSPTDALPHTVRLVALYVRQTHPHFEFSTLSLRLNMTTPPHRDTRNGTSLSYIHSLEPTQGGELWLAHPQGTVPMKHLDTTVYGKVVDVHRQAYTFDARGTLHATMPWRGPRRLVLVAFTTLHSKCPSPLTTKLLSLGISAPLNQAATKQTTLAPFLAPPAPDESKAPLSPSACPADVVEVDSVPSE